MKIEIDVPECACGCGKAVKIKMFSYFDKTCRHRVWLRNAITKEAKRLLAEQENREAGE